MDKPTQEQIDAAPSAEDVRELAHEILILSDEDIPPTELCISEVRIKRIAKRLETFRARILDEAAERAVNKILEFITRDPMTPWVKAIEELYRYIVGHARTEAGKPSGRWTDVNDALPRHGPILVTNRRDGSVQHVWIANAIHEDSDKPSIKDGKYCAFENTSMQKILGGYDVEIFGISTRYRYIMKE